MNEQASAEALTAQHHAALKVRLLKGPVYRAKHRDLWDVLERDQALIRSYFDQIGLSLRLDDAEGYAFLQQREVDTEEEQTEIPDPRPLCRKGRAASPAHRRM